MIEGSFKHLARPRGAAPFSSHGQRGALRELLSRLVIAPFTRLSKLTAIAVPLNAPQQQEEDPPPNPNHPACNEYARSDYCRESWQLHLAELEAHSEPHWHRCAFGVYCGLAPVVCRGCCLAAVKVCCDGSLKEDDFAAKVELLRLIVDAFVAAQGGFLTTIVRATKHGAGKRGVALPVLHVCDGPPDSSGLAAKAVNFIEGHVGDSALTVSQVAVGLGVSPSYLSHIFRSQRGIRMRDFITLRRINLAKDLLQCTDWPIKRIAYSSGFANPNWFGHVFKDQTGMTPAVYRLTGCDAGRNASIA